MKKFFALLLALAMTMSLAACGSSEETTEETTDGDTAAEETTDYASMSDEDLKAAITTITEGTLKVATSPDFAPYEFYAIDESGNAQLAGFEMSLAQYIADYLGLTLEVVPMDFDGTLMELQNKSVDLGMAGYSPKPERENIMDFSEIFYTGGQSFVTTQANADKFTSLEDTNTTLFRSPTSSSCPRFPISLPTCWPATWTVPTSRPSWLRPMPRIIPTSTCCWMSPMSRKAPWWASPRATPLCWRA